MNSKDTYKALLDKTFELEGLLLLALKKQDCPDELKELIERKRSELAFNVEQVKTSNPNLDTNRKNEEPPVGTYYALEDTEDEPREKVETTYKVGKTVNAISEPHEKGQWKKPIFSLNDRFLYMRELFGGDAAVFNKSLNKIASLESYQQAEKYLIDEHGLSPDNETDSSFLEIIESYYNTRK